MTRLTDHQPTILSASMATMPVPGTDTWELHEEWALHLVRYRADVLVTDPQQTHAQALRLHPGSYSLVAPGATMQWLGPTAPGAHVYCLFSSPASWQAPQSGDLGSDCDRLWNDAASMASRRVIRPAQANIQLWALLWELSCLTDDGTPGHSQVLYRACRYIDEHLATDMTVRRVAKAAKVTERALLRCFRDQLGETVVGYIRGRRAERAKDLLVHTSMRIRSIGVAVGIPDPHYFNKVMHRHYGCSPKDIRAQISRL